MHLSLLDTRPFNQFVEMELERDTLYRSFTTLDEPKEISEAWVTFAESCSRNLSAINSLADMAIERIYDVVFDILDGKDNPLPLHQLLYGDFKNQIMALNQFELQLSILTYVYSQVRNRGVFGHSPSSSQYIYYITSKESIDRILYRVLNDQLPPIEIEGLTPTPTKSDLLRVLMPLVQLENQKRLLPIYDSLPESKDDPSVLLVKSEYDYLQGVTLVSHIIDISRKASQDFWWGDPISELSILNHARDHFETTIKYLSKTPETQGNRVHMIKNEFLPIVDAHSSISLVQHFKYLAKNALEIGDLDYATKYYNEAYKEFEKACKLLKSTDNPESRIIHRRLRQDESELRIFESLTKLGLAYSNIVKYLYDQDSDKAVKECLGLEKLLKNIESAGSLPYIYGVSVTYSSAATITSELLEKDLSHLNVIDRLISQFNFPLKAMGSALTDINLDLVQVDDNNPKSSFDHLEELDERLTYLEKSIELLPSFLPDRDNLRKKIHAIRYYVRSMIAENKVYIYADNNIVLDLILRARAHYFAKKANSSLEGIKKKEKLLNTLINDRMIATKTVGMVTESSLVSLGLQSTYKNVVRKFIEELIELTAESEALPKYLGESVEKQFYEMTEFTELIDLILLDTQELIAINKDVAIKGNLINWDFVKRRNIFGPLIKQTFESIRNVLLAEVYHLSGKSDIASGWYLKGGESFFKISETLGNIVEYLEEQQELPQMIYTLSLFCRENASAIRDRRKKRPVPYQEMVSTLDYFILNL